MDNNESFFVTIPVLKDSPRGWGGGHAPAHDPVAASRVEGSWVLALSVFAIAIPLGLAADALLVGLAGPISAELLLVPAAAMIALLAFTAERLPRRAAAGAVLGSLLGAVSPVVYLVYLLFTTPWGF